MSLQDTAHHIIHQATFIQFLILIGASIQRA
jgi:hypothetical protein